MDEVRDREFMQLAIEQARQSKAEDDRVHPMVGAVVVQNGQVLASAHRGELGPGDHGEYTALEKKLAKETLVGATIYVTLEPCTTRKHPKVCCAERLQERGIARVVIGMVDPDHRISGQGISRLRAGRVEVALFPGDLATVVEELNRDFTRHAKEAAAQAAKATNIPVEPRASVQISITNSRIGGDVVGGDKKS